jgi:hypothetical protein
MSVIGLSCSLPSEASPGCACATADKTTAMRVIRRSFRQRGHAIHDQGANDHRDGELCHPAMGMIENCDRPSGKSEQHGRQREGQDAARRAGRGTVAAPAILFPGR